MVSWLLLSTLALAEGPEEPTVQDAWHHYERQRFDEAVQLAVHLLSEDASNLEAHRVYQTALRRQDWNAPSRIAPVYRAWHEENPDHDVARFAYAAALHATSDGEACEDALPLLEPLPEEAANRYSALRITRTWITSCDEERLAEVDAGFSLEDMSVPAAWSYAIWLRAKADDWETVAEALPEVFTRYPSRVISIVRIAASSKSPAAKGVRKDIAAWAEGWPEEQDPIRLRAMVLTLTALDKPADDARARLDALDPPGESNTFEMSKLMSQIYDANKKPTHGLALEALDKLTKKMPESGHERQLWNHLRSERVAALDRPDEAFAILADMAKTQPENGGIVNAWAYEAAVRGEDIDAAIEAMERVLPSLDALHLDLAWGDYDTWMRDAQSERAAWEDTYGWLLFLAGRHAEAAPILVKASQSTRDATISAHAGLALLEIGQEDQAWHYLVDANTQEGGTGEVDLDADMRAALEQLWPARAEFHPEGLDGWLEARRAAEASKPSDEEASEPESHDLIGEDFPYDEADRLGGGTLDLSADTVLVVDLWATWCGPCVQGMPEAYADRGVRVVGLSVDENPSAVKKFYKGVDLDVIAYELGHVGRSGFETMKITGIPALFVVDRDGKIATFISGYGGKDDHRLEQALDDLLGT